jgi:hypothetical protein
MACFQLYGLAVSSVRGQGVFHHTTRCARRGGHHALAHDDGSQREALGCGNIMNKDTPSSVSRPQALLRFMEVGATQAAESERSRRKVAVSGRVQRHERCRRRTCVDRCEPRGRQRGGVHGGASSVPNGRLPIHVEPLEEDEQILSSEYPLPPDLVGRELAEWEVAEPGVLAAADAVSTRTTPQRAADRSSATASSR